MWGHLVQERFDPMTVFEIADEQISVLVGPPTMWAALGQVDLVADDALVVASPSRVPPRCPTGLSRKWRAIRRADPRGLRLDRSRQASPATDDDTPIGSIGRPMAGMEVRIVDAAGEDVYIGDEGEILVWYRLRRLPRRLRGHRSGDGFAGLVAHRRHRRGRRRRIRLHRRPTKDLIIVSGFNVFPAEVERVLNAHPGVVELVVGVLTPNRRVGKGVRGSRAGSSA